MEKEKTLSFEQAKEKALRILEYRSHSEREMRDKLKRAGAQSDDIEHVLSFLREYRFLNDGDYAVRLAKDLKNLRKLGKNRVRAELVKKGIAPELIQNALEEIDWDSEDILLPMVKKKLMGNFDKKNKDKCIRYFLYKGYSFDEIKHAIEKIQSEEQNGV